MNETVGKNHQYNFNPTCLGKFIIQLLQCYCNKLSETKIYHGKST